MSSRATYIHGTDKVEQRRLAVLNDLTNPSFIDFLQLQGRESILETGSGLGLLAGEIARRYPRAQVLGVEYSQQQLDRAGASGRANLRFVRGDAHKLEQESGSFDVVYCRWLLEHVADPVQVLREMRRVLKPGGRICVQENDVSLQRYDPAAPKAERMWELLAILQTKLGGDARIGSRLQGLMTEAGFIHIQLSLAPELHQAGSRGFHVWIENQIGIFKGCAKDLKRHGLAGAAEVAETVEELRGYLKRPQAASLFAWNRAASRR